MAMSLLSFSAAWQACTPDIRQRLEDQLRQAGNAATEPLRCELLQAAAGFPDLPEAMKSAMDEVVRIARHFAFPRELYEALPPEQRPKRYLNGFFNGHLDPKDHLLPQVEATSPLLPLIGYYRARMLIHSVIEHGWLLAYPEKRAAYYGEARQLLETAAEAYPENPVIGMYLGKPIPWQANFPPDDQAPAWANQQREILEKLTDTVHWWINERQVSDGQFGGGWGDDVEMWRNWIPLLVAFEDEAVGAGQQLLSEGLFAQPHMAGGYTNQMTDVEHTAEDSADTCTAMMHLRPDDAIWQARAMRLLELAEEKWTGINERGQLQFKSTYFTSAGPDPDPRKACDTVYHPRALQPTLLHWQRTGDARIGRFVTTWMRTWVEATKRAEHGKPAGIIPSAIHWPDGRVGGLTDEWWNPGNHNDNPLYTWPSAMDMMLDTLLLCYHMTSDRYFLAPLFSMTAIYNQREKGKAAAEFAEGTEAWCAAQMQEFLPEALAKYQKLTGDKTFTAIIEASGDGYAQFAFSNERTALEKDLTTQWQVFQRDEPTFTSEVLWTDRLFSFYKNYLNFFEDQPLPSFKPNFLFSTLTGHVGNALYFPLNAVRWHTPAREIAALVTVAQQDRFAAELFHFGEQPRGMAASFFLLTPGNYEVRITDITSSKISSRQRVVLSNNARRIPFQLPARQPCRLEINPI